MESTRVRGVGFDATCSLVVLDQSFQPVPVTQDGKIRISFYSKTREKNKYICTVFCFFLCFGHDGVLYAIFIVVF